MQGDTMKCLLSLLIICCALGLVASSVSDVQWRNYKRKFGKAYADPKEDSARKSLFLSSKRLIEQHNARQTSQGSHKLGLNHLSDRTEAEIRRMSGFKLTSEQYDELMLEHKLDASHPMGYLMVDGNEMETLPAKVDWRLVHGRVSPVKDQGWCGSCWAFATTGLLEGQERVRNITRLNRDSGTHEVIPLSEQNLLDCSKQNHGCDGGAMPYALQDIAKERGIDDEDSYPYVSYPHECRYNPDKSVMTDSGFKLLEPTELALQKAVATFGPVAVAMNSTGIRNYKSGVYYDPDCKPVVKGLDHAVLVVGYGTDPKEGDYWLIKNSVSFMWGEQGFLRMARNRGNQCGVALFPTIPTF